MVYQHLVGVSSFVSLLLGKAREQGVGSDPRECALQRSSCEKSTVRGIRKEQIKLTDICLIQ